MYKETDHRPNMCEALASVLSPKGEDAHGGNPASYMNCNTFTFYICLIINTIN